jgi:hypothetical protein
MKSAASCFITATKNRFAASSRPETRAYPLPPVRSALFKAGTKFESGTGWPSFTAPFDEEHLRWSATPAPAWQDGSRLRPLRRAAGPCRRRPADGPALLYQLAVAALHAEWRAVAGHAGRGAPRAKQRRLMRA